VGFGQVKGTQHLLPDTSWRLASTSVGGRLSIALNPNQGFSAVGGQKTLKNQ